MWNIHVSFYGLRICYRTFVVFKKKLSTLDCDDKIGLLTKKTWFFFVFLSVFFPFFIETTASRAVNQKVNTAWKVSVFGVFLVRILPHSHQKNSEYGHFSRNVYFKPFYFYAAFSNSERQVSEAAIYRHSMKSIRSVKVWEFKNSQKRKCKWGSPSISSTKAEIIWQRIVKGIINEWYCSFMRLIRFRKIYRCQKLNRLCKCCNTFFVT